MLLYLEAGSKNIMVCVLCVGSMRTGAVMEIGSGASFFAAVFSGVLKTPMYLANAPNGVPSLEEPHPLR